MKREQIIAEYTAIAWLKADFKWFEMHNQCTFTDYWNMELLSWGYREGISLVYCWNEVKEQGKLFQVRSKYFQ